ncbi:MAG: hypothetical protein IPI21_15285 [Propionivibrio sp.]|nr:hypothetical protein [Propionivibrio sp.]
MPTFSPPLPRTCTGAQSRQAGAQPPLPARSAKPLPHSLAPDSLGWSLLLAARWPVLGGKGLNDARILADEPPKARAAAQDVAYGVLRRYGCGEFILDIVQA